MVSSIECRLAVVGAGTRVEAFAAFAQVEKAGEFEAESRKNWYRRLMLCFMGWFIRRGLRRSLEALKATAEWQERA